MFRDKLRESDKEADLQSRHAMVRQPLPAIVSNRPHTVKPALIMAGIHTDNESWLPKMK